MQGLQSGDKVLISYANPDNRSWYISANLSMGPDKQDTRQLTNTGTTGAIAFSIDGHDDFDLPLLFIKLNTAPSSAGNLTITFDATTGSTYDTVTHTVNPVGKTSIVYLNGKILVDGEPVETTLAGYDEAAGVMPTAEGNPISDHHSEDIIAAATSQTDGTTYYYVDMDGYRKLGIQIENTDGTAGDNTYTVEASLQDDGTAPASCAYQDITQYGCDCMTAANAASFTADAILQTNDAAQAFKYIRVKVVRANDGSNNDGAWTIYAKRLY